MPYGSFYKEQAQANQQEDPMWPAIIAGGAALLGGVLGNKANAKQAKAQMDFQAQQSATAHQREVSDLRAAGLNPILSGTGGMGAASGSGAMAQQQNVLGPAVSSALEARRNVADVKATNQAEKTSAQQERVLHEQTKKEEALARQANSEAELANYELGAVTEAMRGHGYQTARARELVENAKASGTAAQIERELDEDAGTVLRSLKRLGISGSTAIQLMNTQRNRVPRNPRYPGDLRR